MNNQGYCSYKAGKFNEFKCGITLRIPEPVFLYFILFFLSLMTSIPLPAQEIEIPEVRPEDNVAENIEQPLTNVGIEVNQISALEILKSMLPSEIHRFRSVNPDVNLTVDELSTFILPALSELSINVTIDDNQGFGGIRTNIGIPLLTEIFEKGFHKLITTQELPEKFVNNYIEDLHKQNSIFARIKNILIIYIINQFIPLSLDQCEKILASEMYADQTTGKALDSAMMIKFQSMYSLLSTYVTPEIENLFHEPQATLYTILKSSWTTKPVREIYLRLDQLKNELNQPEEERIYFPIFIQYFQTLIRMWEMQYRISGEDVEKLYLFSKFLVTQCVSFYSDEEKVRSLASLKRESVNQTPSTQLMRTWPSWTKMVEKISKELKTVATPDDEQRFFSRLNTELNISFVLMMINIYGPEMGGQQQSPGLTGSQIGQIIDRFMAIYQNREAASNFPDIEILADMLLARRATFSDYVSTSMMSVIDEMSEELKRDVHRADQNNNQVDVEIRP